MRHGAERPQRLFAGRQRSPRLADVRRPPLHIRAKAERAGGAETHIHAERAEAARPTSRAQVPRRWRVEVNIIRKKGLPLAIERGGRRQHAVYDILPAELTAAEELNRLHSPRAPRPYTDFTANHIDTNELRPLATVLCKDEA